MDEENVTEKIDGADGRTESTYIYLDFNGKLPNDVFQHQVFFRIANLHKKNPLVQVNDSLFKGTYDWTIGTNLFFEETDDNCHTGNAFEKPRPLYLKHFLSTSKLLSLQQVKIPQTKAVIQNEIRSINYNLTWDYNELLGKLENRTLRIEDISSEEALPERMEVEQEKDKETESEENNDKEISTTFTEPETDLRQDENLENALENIMPAKMLEAEYKQLCVLASRPVRRATSPELVAECDEKYAKAFEYHNIERQILQPRDGFKSEVVHVDEETLSDSIDIDRCVFYGLIPVSSDLPRVLSEQEKEKLLTLENFDNLSLAARYYVLQNIVNDLGKYVNCATPENLQDKDEYDRSPLETLEIYKKLTEAVRNRLQQIKYSLENEREGYL